MSQEAYRGKTAIPFDDDQLPFRTRNEERLVRKKPVRSNREGKFVHREVAPKGLQKLILTDALLV